MSDVVLGTGPVLWLIRFGVDLERAAKRLHPLIEQAGGFVSGHIVSFVHKYNPEIPLRPCPVLGLIGSGVNRERASKCLHSLIEQADSLVPATPCSLSCEHNPEIVLRLGPILGHIGFGTHLKSAAKCLDRLIEQGSGLVSACPRALLLESSAETVLCRGCLLAISQHSVLARQRLVIVRGLFEQRETHVGGSDAALARARIRRVPDRLKPKLVEAFIVMEFVVFGVNGSCRALQRLRGLVILAVQAIRARGLLAVIEKLAHRGSKLVKQRLLSRLQGLHLRLKSFFLRRESLLLRVLRVDRQAIGIAGLIEELSSIGVVVEREFRQRLLLRRRSARLLLDLLSPLLHLLIGLPGGEAIGLRPLGHCGAQVRLLRLRCILRRCIRLR